MSSKVLLGDITCKSVQMTRELRKSVEKQLASWAECQSLEPFPKAITYHVVFDQEELQPGGEPSGEEETSSADAPSTDVRCQVMIHSRSCSWIASSLGSSPEIALEKCMGRLQKRARVSVQGGPSLTRTVPAPCAPAPAADSTPQRAS